MKNKIWLGLLAGSLCLAAQANERLFTYTYEPETLPKGGWEFEQWLTLRAGRDKAVGQENYNEWEIRESVEYGVTDNYTAELYVNTKSENYRDVTTSPASDYSKFSFDGISIENRYMVWNPADHKVGLTLYLEPSFSGVEAEVEEKIIIGQRFGQWKWAVNLTHATEWDDHFGSTEGELEGSFGLARFLNKNWAVGLELRDHSEIPDYKEFENTAIYLGPVVSYRNETWWATLTVMPQIYGANFIGNPDHNPHLELEGHERWNVRLVFGFGF